MPNENTVDLQIIWLSCERTLT